MEKSKVIGEFRKIMENADPSKIAASLMYDPETDGQKLDNWETELEDEFYKLFGKISTMVPDDFQHMDELRTAVYNMSNKRDEIYFHLGMLYGFNLHRNFSDGYVKSNTDTHYNMENNDLIKFLEKILADTKELSQRTENYIRLLSDK